MEQPAKHQEFASDNTLGICPEALAALEEANCGATEFGTAMTNGRDVSANQSAIFSRRLRHPACFQRHCGKRSGSRAAM